MWRRTRELARSGECANWQEIERKLDAAGYASASQLWSISFRQVLDRLCAAAREADRVGPLNAQDTAAANDVGSLPPFPLSA